jgi:hypothetical protein
MTFLKYIHSFCSNFSNNLKCAILGNQHNHLPRSRIIIKLLKGNSYTLKIIPIDTSLIDIYHKIFTLAELKVLNITQAYTILY